MPAKTFRGWPAQAFDFYHGLEADNSKAYWQANKSVYEDAVRAPFEALLSDLETPFGPFRMFRPYRDVRFSKNKSPYKTAAAAASETQGGASLYVHLSASGLFVGSGYYHMAPDQLTRFREALDDDTRGEAIVAVCGALERKGHELAAHDELKTAPRGYPKDHPRIDYLRRKGLVAGRTFAVAAWMHTPKAEDRIVEVWRQQAPMDEWLDANVGPSELPPEDQEW
jgi:uncharacterized protein (TIGR02453 family)